MAFIAYKDCPYCKGTGWIKQNDFETTCSVCSNKFHQEIAQNKEIK